MMSDEQVPSATLEVIFKAVYSCTTYLLTEDEIHGNNMIHELCATFQTLFVQRDVAAASECSTYIHD